MVAGCRDAKGLLSLLNGTLAVLAQFKFLSSWVSSVLERSLARECSKAHD
jgi:hypothetical protein